MSKLDALIAPRALTAREIAEVAVPHLIAYGVAHRGFIHAGVIADGPDREGSTVYACESALIAIAGDAETSVRQWLGDCQTDGQPRFYQNKGLIAAVAGLCAEVGRRFAELEDSQSVDRHVRLLEDRDGSALDAIVEAA